MRIKRVRLQSFKRFTDLTIEGLPVNTRLVMMIGQNGSGKSSLFDAFRLWHNNQGGPSAGQDPIYHFKQGSLPRDWGQVSQIEFHETLPQDPQGRQKLFYMRSPYRHTPDFTSGGFSRMGSEFDAPKAARMMDNDPPMVQDNYQRLVSATVDQLYSGQHDDETVRELRQHLIGEIRDSMRRVFGDLIFTGVGHPLQGGSFFFDKGVSNDFHYKNLSSGEKSAFDILLDLIIKRRGYDNTVYCIDEPDLHMHTGLQARLLEEILNLLPPNCQLWIAAHSIGLMRKAKDLKEQDRDAIVFLNFQDVDFDSPATLRPAELTRGFWLRTLEVALDDLAGLVAPRQVVVCEGLPVGSARTNKAEFDAECCRTIFGKEHPDADFISVGNEAAVRTDQLGIGKAIQALVKGTTVIRLVDRDDRSDEEVQRLKQGGVRVLTRRNLESYLLDDEVLLSLCESVGKPEMGQQVLQVKRKALEDSVFRGHPPDDLKSAAGEIYDKVKRILELSQAGSTTDSFLRDTLAPLVVPGTAVYGELKRDVFG